MQPDHAQAHVVVKFGLAVGGRELEASARVPAGPARVADVLPVLYGIASAIVSVAEADVQEEGKTISCRAGCGACCRQIVPISEPDARFLAELVAEMPEPRRGKVMARFRDALARFEEIGLLDKIRNIASYPPKERLAIAMDYFHAGVPCPFLENESCSIHLVRPTVCREYLVTSPPENCSHPTAENIETVPLPAKASLALYRFSDGRGEDQWRFMALVLALEWAAAHEADPQTRLPAPEIVLNFVRALAHLPPDAPIPLPR